MKRLSLLRTLIIILSLASLSACNYLREIPETAPVAIATGHPLASIAAEEVLRRGGTAADAFIAASLMLSNVEPEASGLGGGFFAVYYDAQKDKVFTVDAREEAPSDIDPKSFLRKDGGVRRFFPDRQSSALAVGVPGSADGYALVHRNFGKLSLDKIINPVAVVAKRGFRINDKLAGNILNDSLNSCAKIGIPRLALFPATRKLFFKALEDTEEAFFKCSKEGSSASEYYPWQPLRERDLLVNEDYAETLDFLAKNGFESFYSSKIAKEITKLINEPKSYADLDLPGIEHKQTPYKLGKSTAKLSDFKNYRAVLRDPIEFTYRGKGKLGKTKKYKVYGMGPPSSGAIAIAQMLNLLDDPNTKARENDIAKLKPVERASLLSKLSKLAFHDRNIFLADEDFVSDLEQIKKGLISTDYANELRLASLSTDHQAPSVFSFLDNFEPKNKFIASLYDDEQGTAHISISDKFGNVISATVTVEAPFGNGMVVPGYGFILNNELTDFEPLLGRANSIEAGRKKRRSAKGFTSRNEIASWTSGSKRPRSSMSPLIVMAKVSSQDLGIEDTDKKKHYRPVAAIGAAGGSTIIGSTLQVLLNIFEHKMDTDAAVKAARLYNLDRGSILLDEELYADKLFVSELQAANPSEKIKSIRPGLTGAQAIFIDWKHHKAYAGVDSVRRDGLGIDSK